MHSRLIQILTDIKNPTIMVVGDLMLDKYVWGEVNRISPEAPIPVINVTREELRPGGVGAVISNLIHLGARVLCAGVVGRDAEGQNLSEMIRKLGVDTSGIFVDAERPTTVKTRMMGHLHTAGRGVQQLLRIDYERTHPVPKVIEDSVLNYIRSNLHRCDAVALSDMNKGLLTEGLLKTISRLGNEAGKPIIVDPRVGNDCSIYKGVTAVTPNRHETEIMTGVDVSRPENLERAGIKLVDGLGLQCAIITLDKDGIFLYQRGGAHLMLPITPREVYDVTGAGDMILSMITFVVAGGFGFVDAARLANVAAGIEVGKIGVAPVSREEMMRALAGHHPSLEKIKTVEELKKILDNHRSRKERIVFTNGCFDILHRGHIEYLGFARNQGDLLVVGLNTDRSVNDMKGPGRPVTPELDRARVLASLEDVDYVVLFDEPTPEELIRDVRPDVLVKGEDWREKGVVGREFVESYGGKVVLAPLVQGISTTDIISKIVENKRTTPAT